MSKDELYKIFIKWYSQPEDKRDPQTIKDFGLLHGLSPKDIAEFTERDNYYDDLYKEAQNWGKSKIPELLGILYNEFKLSKKSETLRVYKELLQLNDKQGGSNVIVNILNPNDTTYRKIVEREARLLADGGEQPPVEFLPTN